MTIHRINVGNPEVTIDSNILDIEVPKQMETNVSTGFAHVDALCAGDGITPSTVLLLTGLPGAGKCLGFNTPILMFDGTIKMVQDIKVGDQLMGPDSNPRNVLSLARGKEEMFEITPVKGDSWTCNRSHILSLIYSGNGKIKNINVNDFLKLGKESQKRYKQYRTNTINFKEQKTDLEPYLVGIWLGDGTIGKADITNMEPEIIKYFTDYCKKNNFKLNKTANKHSKKCFRLSLTKKEKNSHIKNPVKEFLMKNYKNNEKRIDAQYLINSEKVRLELLAGLIDTNGYLDHHNGYQIMTKYEGLKNDILFLARSLGLAAYASKLTKKIKSSGFSGKYWSVSISGDVKKIPCKVKKKQAKSRKQAKNVLRTGITLKSKGVGDYYGFEIDGDHLFVLGDFTVTHNTTLQLQLADSITRKGHVALVNTNEESLYQVRRTMKRLRLKNGFVPSYQAEVHQLINYADKVRQKHEGKQLFLFVDSLQTLEYDSGKAGRPMAQMNAAVEATWELAAWAKANYTIVILIGQVTKDGTFAGKQEIKHAIDAHLHLGIDTDRKSETYGERIIEVQKNRFGQAGIFLNFQITPEGLQFENLNKT